MWTAGRDNRRRPALEGGVAADVCVVGLGNSGLTAVATALAAGATVVGLDAGRVAGGAAGRNGGFLMAGLAVFHHRAVAQFGHERARRLYQATLAELDRIAAATPEAVRRTGSLRIAMSEAERTDCAAHAGQLAADGFHAELYAGPEGEGVLFPDDAAGDPLLRAQLGARRVEAAGAVIHEMTPVSTVRPQSVVTARGTLRCRAVVAAVDGGLELLFPGLAHRARTTRLQMLATAPVGRVVAARPVYARYGYEYYWQLPDGRVVLGGFRDRHAADEWGAPAEPSAPVQADLETFLRERLGVGEPVTHRWAGRAAYSPDHLPVLEEWSPGVFVTGAYSGLGNVLGSLCARSATARALGLDDPLSGLL